MDSTQDTAPRVDAKGAPRVARLEERYRHELMGEDERQELRETIVRLKRKIGEGEA